MPVTVPNAVERIAEQNGAEIVRTRSDRRSLMALAEKDGKSLAFAGGSDYELIFPEFQPAFDGLYGAAKVMELLAAEHQRASELVDQLPDWHMASLAVPCPWDRKGLVMRALHDESRNGKGVQMIDGIRIAENGGWVLVLPDASEADGQRDRREHQRRERRTNRRAHGPPHHRPDRGLNPCSSPCGVSASSSAPGRRSRFSLRLRAP